MKKGMRWFVLVLSLVGTAHAQVPAMEAWRERGRPFLHNYTPKDYQEHTQNWAVIQDRRGVVYAANGQGVLEYDGVSWRLIETGGTLVRSLARGDDGTIYVGAYGDFGYLAPDSIGRMQFVSLRDTLDADARDVADVWRTYHTRDGVYFQTFETLFRWADGRMQTWRVDPVFFLSAAVHDTLYIEQRHVGLLKVVGDSLQVIEASRPWAPLMLYGMAAFDEQRILVGSGKHGLLLYDGRTMTRFETEADAFLQENRLSSVAALPNGFFALGTYRGGVVIIDREGRVRQVINKAVAGLQDDDVKDIYVDDRGALWLSLNVGITHVQPPSSVSYFTEAEGLNGTVLSVARHQGILYVATTQGVYYLDVTSAGATWTYGIFRAVEQIVNQSFALVSAGATLLAATNIGVYRVEGRRGYRIDGARESAFVLYRSQQDSNRVYVGLKDGLAVLDARDGGWAYSGRLKGTTGEVRSIVEDADGALWLGTTFEGVLRVQVTTDTAGDWQTTVERFGAEHRLPEKDVNVAMIRGRVLFATQEGLRRFDEMHAQFLPDTTLGTELADTTRWVYLVEKDRLGRVGIWSGNGNEGDAWLALPQADGTYTLAKDRWVQAAQLGSVRTFYSDADHVVWLGGTQGLMRCDPSAYREDTADNPALIRRVATITDGVPVYGGFAAATLDAPVLPYRNNALHFEYALPAFEDVAANRYQYRLEGFDADWSDWKTETRKDYTNLPEGAYRFLVRARDAGGHVHEGAHFAFRLLPPWYRTWWAYGLYLLLAGCFVYGIVRWRLARLASENKRLEQVVADRTAALQQALQHLTQTQDQLIHAEKMISLGQLTAGVAHEIKNPLNFVNNFSQLSVELMDELVEELEANREKTVADVLDGLQDVLSDLKSNARRVHQHGQRADHIVRSMMQHARRNPGKREMTDVNMLLDEYVDLAYHGARVQLPDFVVALERRYDEAVGPTLLVPEEMGRVFLNLLNNAFYAVSEHVRFRDVAYQPTVTVTTRQHDEYVQIRVHDNGPGIPAAIRGRIFEPFFTTKPTGTGTGLGLSLSYDIVVHGHGGLLEVERNDDGGATFVVTLPVKKEKKEGGDPVHQAEASHVAAQGLLGLLPFVSFLFMK